MSVPKGIWGEPIMDIRPVKVTFRDWLRGYVMIRYPRPRPLLPGDFAEQARRNREAKPE